MTCDLFIGAQDLNLGCRDVCTVVLLSSSPVKDSGLSSQRSRVRIPAGAPSFLIAYVWGDNGFLAFTVLRECLWFIDSRFS